MAHPAGSPQQVQERPLGRRQLLGAIAQTLEHAQAADIHQSKS
jgi:hypothetical protein